MESTLAGRNALVTGANGGLGSHFAATLESGRERRACRAPD
jgi:NAD(P)-dependent dehydrogenase (short-subunit alcohol dehydrogenase family)